MSMETENTQDIQRADENRFTAQMEEIIKESEVMRLRYMQRHRGREAVAMIVGLLSILAGAGGFGWYLLMEADLPKAIASVILAIILPLFLHFWSEAPLKAYIADHKTIFMPKMAKALGGLRFYPSRGIGLQILSKTGVLPAHDSYEAEDCFMGQYKGSKLIFSEAKLQKTKGRRENLFSGVFVLLEMSQSFFDGHTIITANKDMAQQYAPTRWKKLQPVTLSGHYAERFTAYADKPDAAAPLLGEKLLKELAEASDIFEKSPLTAVFFRGKYLFLMIPSPYNMFEASNIFVPVTTRQHAVTCKKEIERILEIADVLDIYRIAAPTTG